jgi:nitroreductase
VQLAAQSLGLGSCWVQIRNRSHDADRSAEACVQDLLGIPPRMRVLSIVAIGRPAEDKDGHPGTSLDRRKIHRNTY